VNNGPVILLDVDGVINLARFRSSRQRGRMIREGYFHRRPSDPFADDRLLVDLRAVRPLVHALLDSGAELAWATTWEGEANEVFSPLLGLPVLPVAPAFHGGLKAHLVIPWTQGRPWAWLEDQENELILASHLSPGRPHLPVLVEHETGLAGKHVDAVSEWLAGL
jgi:hypothetical protein